MSLCRGKGLWGWGKELFQTNVSATRYRSQDSNLSQMGKFQERMRDWVLGLLSRSRGMGWRLPSSRCWLLHLVCAMEGRVLVDVSLSSDWATRFRSSSSTSTLVRLGEDDRYYYLLVSMLYWDEVYQTDSICVSVSFGLVQTVVFF